MSVPRDHRQLLSKKKPIQPEQPSRWWALPDKEVASAALQTVTLLHQVQTPRLIGMLANARLYGNISVAGSIGTSVSKYGQLRPATPGKSSFNVCQSVVDSICAKIAKSKPEPMYLTSGGNFHQQRRAQKLTDWTNGVFYENRTHALAVQAFRDAAIWGTGVLHVFPEHGKVQFERVMPAEILIDEMEAFYGFPRQMHRAKAVDRQVLLECYPEKRKVLEYLTPALLDPLAYSSYADLLQVVESWHLPSGPESSDGRHIIACGDQVLFSEEWTRSEFPMVFFHYAPRQYGFWAQSLVEQLQGIQLEINQLSWVAQQSFRLAGSFKVFVKAGSKVVKEHLNNDVGSIIEYAGDTAPVYATPPIISPDHLARIERLKQNAYELAGISQLSAASQKPAGLNSGKALREYNDIESDRFTTIGQAWEQLHVSLANQAVCTARAIAETDPSKLSARTPGKKALKQIDWDACAMDEEEYITKVFPVSSLPNEPAGRLQTISEMVQAGMLSPERGRRLLDFPDLDAEEGLQNAQQDYLHSVLDKIVDDGEYTPPEPTDNLQLGRELAMEYLSLGKSSDLESERCDMLRQFIEQIDGLTQEAMPPAPVGPTPQAAPMPQPTSDLIPNVPG